MPIVTRLPSARSRTRGLALAAALAVITTFAACSEPTGTTDAAAERGRQIYLSQCIACHNRDPALAGPLGPPVKGASRELLEAKVLKGTYPPGYRPKRPTNLMPPQPAFEPDVPNLAAYLK